MASSIKFKTYEKGEINSVNVNAVKLNRTIPALYKYNEKMNLFSEEVGKEYYTNNGYNAEFTENDVWQVLFRLFILKNIKKAYREGKIKEYKVSKLNEDFINKNEAIISQIFEDLRNSNLNESANKIRDETLKKQIGILTKHLETDQILSILFFMLSDFINNRRGFPDLMVWNEEEIFFAEVKARGDKLSKWQTHTHKALLDAGINIDLFSINKNERRINREFERYEIKESFREENIKKERVTKYDKKVKTALKELEILENNGNSIEGLNDNSDYSIAYLNILYDLNVNSFNRLNKNKVKKERINELLETEIDEVRQNRLYDEANKLYYEYEYEKAARVFEQFLDHYKIPYYKIYVCYKKMKDYENLFRILFKAIHDEKFTKGKKRSLRYKLNNLLNSEYMETNSTEYECPNCGNKLVFKQCTTNKDISFYMCEKKNCYWFSGIMKNENKDIQEILDENKYQASPLIDDDELSLYLDEAKECEYNKQFNKAIEIYKSIDHKDSKAFRYKRMCIVYRRMGDIESELKLIKEAIYDKDISKHKKSYFKRRLKRFLNENQYLESVKTDKLCPKCGGQLYENTFYEYDEITSFYMCKTEKCYWIEGIKKEE